MSTITYVRQARISPIKIKRIGSIDLLRGIIMIVMALDHTRNYFHAGVFVHDPTNLASTTVMVFMTRWITHFCAPVFMLLAGVSAFISGRRKTKKELSSFLLRRGLWLIFLELTVLNFGWFFNIHFTYISLQVIWALGSCMICLSGLIYLPGKTLLVTSIALVIGHNLLDNIHVPGNGPGAFIWHILHERGLFEVGSKNLNITYPLVPWIGVMSLGYCLGKIFDRDFDAARRKNLLITLGSSSVALFFILRFANGYGDPAPWSLQSSGMFSFLSFINVTKYPPSLDYLLITLGVAFLFLAFTENLSNRATRIVSIYGRVPMLYYLAHIYLIHLLALVAVASQGYPWTAMTSFPKGVHYVPFLSNYGFNLPVVYGVWIAVVALLFPLCKWYDGYKTRHKEKWWLSYL